MVKVWREIADPTKHTNYMSTYTEGGVPIESSRDNLIEKWIYMAEVHGFTFQFANLEQVKSCRDYFERNVHPSTREPMPPAAEHYWQPWYSRLPKGINKNSKRQKVVKALDLILEKWGP